MPPEQQTDVKTVAQYRLEDVNVKEVSVVDRGANLRPLLVVKNDEGTVPDPVVEAQAEKAEKNTDLIVALPLELRDELAKMLSDVSTRLGALGEAVKATDPGEGGLSDKFKSEMVGLGAVLKRLGGVEKSQAINPLDKAALESGGEIDRNGLPRANKDAAFEYVMTADGPLMKMPKDEMMKVAMRYAIDEMYKAEDCLYYDADMSSACKYMSGAMKALGPFITEGNMTAMQMAETIKQYAYNQPQASVAAGVPLATKGENEPEEGMGKGNAGDLTKKGHKQFTPERQAVLTDMMQKLQAMLGDVAPIPTGSTETVVENEVTKTEAGIPTEVQLAMTKMASLIKSLKAENDSLRSSRPLGNATEPSGETPTPVRAKVHWPDDLNDLDDPDLE